MRLDKAKDSAIQEYLETLSKYCMLVQFGARSRERIAIFTERGHMHSFSTAHYHLFAWRKWYA